jgi:hypothetical protein
LRGWGWDASRMRTTARSILSIAPFYY